jgi:hypothetical protein
VLIILLTVLARRGRAAGGEAVTHTERKAVEPAGPEGRAVTDEGAAAARDVAGQILGGSTSISTSRPPTGRRTISRP